MGCLSELLNPSSNFQLPLNAPEALFNSVYVTMLVDSPHPARRRLSQNMGSHETALHPFHHRLQHGCGNLGTARPRSAGIVAGMRALSPWARAAAPGVRARKYAPCQPPGSDTLLRVQKIFMILDCQNPQNDLLLKLWKL